jgi:hypothetical protein
MLRGRPHLLKHMPEPKDARRLVPDPENEPDFHAIGKLYPLESSLPPSQENSYDTDNAVLPAAHPTHQARLASSVDWLADEAPASKRMNIDVAVDQYSGSSALSHAFSNGQVLNMASASAEPQLPLPQYVAPGNNNNMMSPDLLLTTLLQQMASNPHLMNNLQAHVPYQLQPQSHPTSMAEWLLQQQQGSTGRSS